jgi:hypothetical protein
MVIQPELHYHLQQTAFLSGSDFLSNFTGYAGGLAEYAALFVMQFLSFNILGSIIIAIISLAMGYILLYICDKNKTLKVGKMFIIAFPSIICIGLFTSYYFPLAALIKIFLSWLALAFIVKLKLTSNWQIAVYMALAMLTYYLAGGIALAILAASLVIYLLSDNLSKRNILISSIILLFAAFIPYAAFKWIFLTDLRDAFFLLYPKVPNFIRYKPNILMDILIALLPATILVVHFVYKSIKKTENKTTVKKEKSSFFQKLQHPVVVNVIEIAVIVGIGYKVYTHTYDHDALLKAEIGKYLEDENWNKVILLSQDLSTYDWLINTQVNRALANIQKLNQNLFTSPQLTGADGLFPDKFTTGENAIPSSDVYFDLGHISESRHWAFEAQTLQPYSPRVLKRLIDVSLIMNDLDLANEFLSVLDKNFLYKDYVAEKRKWISDTSQLSKNQIIALKRKQMPVDSIFSNSGEEKLLVLLKQDSTNQMAFDYLTANYILTNNLGMLNQLSEKARNFGHKKLPRYCEQALMLFGLKTNAYQQVIDKYAISSESINEFNNFNQTMMQNIRDKERMQNMLKRNFGQTYWYYVRYESPMVTKAELKTRDVEPE